MPYRAVLSILFIALLVIVAIACSGHFQMYNIQGILSGPFSALLLLGAIVSAAFLLVLLDWKIWYPQRIARAAAFARWLSNLFGDPSANSVQWQTVRGKFENRNVTLSRVAGGVNWSVESAFTVEFSVVRLPGKTRTKSDGGEFATGDADFDECYQWQSAQPVEALPLLKNAEVQGVLKRLATLIAQRGNIAETQNGVRAAGGRIGVTQAPAPWLRGTESAADEVLFILSDLCALAARLEGRVDPVATSQTANNADSNRAGVPNSLAWWGIACAGLLVIALWLSGTWVLARLIGMSAAMLGFFIPPLMLALLFMYSSANSTGRDPELEDYIKKEARELLRKRSDLQALRSRMT